MLDWFKNVIREISPCHSRVQHLIKEMLLKDISAFVLFNMFNIFRYSLVTFDIQLSTFLLTFQYQHLLSPVVSAPHKRPGCYLDSKYKPAHVDEH